MKKRLMLGLIISCLSLRAQPGRAEDVPTLLKALDASVAMLRIEVADMRIETIRARLPLLEGQIRAARQERSRLQEEEQAHEHGLRQIDQMLREISDAGERSHIEAYRKEVQAGQFDRLRMAASAALRRETDLSEQLSVDRRSLEQLVAFRRQIAQHLNRP